MRTEPPPELPRDLDAERAVLGAVLLDAAAFASVDALLSSDDFLLAEHRHIFRGMAQLAGRGEPIDALQLKLVLERNGGVEDAGGVAYIASLPDGVPDVGNVEYYARAVRDKARLRELLRVSQKLTRDCLARASAPTPLIEEAVISFRELAQGGDNATALTGDGVPTSWHRPAEVLRASPLPTVRFPSTVPAINDASRGGLPCRALVVYQGPPDSGKTGLGIQDIVAIAMAHDVVAVLYTPDQGREATAVRVGTLLGLDARKLEERDPTEIARLADLIGERRVFLPDDSEEGNTLETIVRDAEKVSPNLPHILLADSLQEARSSAKTDNGGEKERVVANVRACQQAVKSPSVAWLVISTSQTTKASAGSDPKARPPAILAGAESAKIGFAPQLMVHLDGDPAQAPGFGRGRIAKNKLGGPKLSFGLRLNRETTLLEEIDPEVAADSRQRADDEKRLQASERAQKAVLVGLDTTPPRRGDPGLSESRLARAAGLRKSGRPFLDALQALTTVQRVLEAVDGPRDGTYYRRRVP